MFPPHCDEMQVVDPSGPTESSSRANGAQLGSRTSDGASS